VQAHGGSGVVTARIAGVRCFAAFVFALSVVGGADVVGGTIVLAAEVAGNTVGADGGLSGCGVK
jgi:hypothetical protein